MSAFPLPTGPVATYLRAQACGFLVTDGGDEDGVAIAFIATGTAQWSRPPVSAERHVPGSNTIVRQFLGLQARTVSYDLVLANVDDLATLFNLQGTVGTLTVLPNTAAVDDRFATVIAGRIYDRIPDVTLKSVDSTSFARGSAQCTATFAMDDD